MMRRSTVVRYALVLLLGVSAGYVFRDRTAPHDAAGLHFESLRDRRFVYTHPLLDVILARNASQNVGLRPFMSRVEARISEIVAKKWAVAMSVYFRDLSNGPWFDIGETEGFYPASLLKIPLMMAVLKQAEANPNLLKESIQYADADLQTLQNNVSVSMEPGRSYTVEGMLERMIINSDDVAAQHLDQWIDADVRHTTYVQLGLVDPHADFDKTAAAAALGYAISVEQYASFFRVLFNASYLNREMSEKALALLTRTDYKSGLTSGVPAQIEVAHKWGYLEYGDSEEVHQLHDCGIIYYPRFPYLLCVMSIGNSYDFLDDAIKEISSTVYHEVDAQRLRHR